MTVRILTGDCRTLLASLDAGSVQTCVTSPPYFGLRDYGVAGQIGLEATPDAFVTELVAVFRDVRRVLRDDGTLWLNLGDSYAGSWGAQSRGNTTGEAKSRLEGSSMLSARQIASHPLGMTGTGSLKNTPGIKAKDLIGIPWRVAFALQQPYYTGTIRDVMDRVWLAAMIDAEGCMFIHKRKAGQSNGQGYERQNDTFSAGMEVSNTHRSIIERVVAITGRGSVSEQTEGRRQTLYRWNLRSNECRDVIREVYPYLVGKQHQARLTLGCPSSGERATAAWLGLKALHSGSTTDVDFPAPGPMTEPGYYLRSDIIWKKPNPMPESVTDRPTKSHEYLFLLSKAERYYYDAPSIMEGLAASSVERLSQSVEQQTGSARANGGTRASRPMKAVSRKRGIPPRHQQYAESSDQSGLDSVGRGAGRNKRSVWTIATTPYKGAHFATFPPALIEPCILAGSRPGDTVLDPFGGAGTTGLVADRLGRDAVLVELNPDYAAMARARITADAPLFSDGAA